MTTVAPGVTLAGGVEVEGAIMLRPTRRHVLLTGLAFGLLLAGSLLASDALAGRGISLRDAFRQLRELVAGLVERVDAIEEADCACPGVLEPVCLNGTTWQNQCEAICALGRLDDAPTFIQFSQGPCDRDQPLCGDFACTEGRVCIDGVCSRGKCEGFVERFDCRGVGCPRGSHCATYPETGCIASFCGCDPRTGGFLCTSDCAGSICLPDDFDLPVPPLPWPVFELPPIGSR